MDVRKRGVKKAESRRIDAFKLWWWRRLLRVLWTARRSNQSILKEISPEYSLEGLMLKLKLQYFSYLMAKNWLIGKDPDAGKDWRQEEKAPTEDAIFAWHHWHEFKQALEVGDGQGSLGCCSPWGCKEWDTTEWLWTELECPNWVLIMVVWPLPKSQAGQSLWIPPASAKGAGIYVTAVFACKELKLTPTKARRACWTDCEFTRSSEGGSGRNFPLEWCFSNFPWGSS